MQKQVNNSPLLSPSDIKYVQPVVESFLHYARALDASMLPALNEMPGSWSQSTTLTRQRRQRFMDYANTYQNISIRYHASDMSLILHVDSDAAYLVAPKARSRIISYYYVSDHPTKKNSPTHNDPFLIECKTLRHVVSSSA